METQTLAEKFGSMGKTSPPFPPFAGMTRIRFGGSPPQHGLSVP
jgi:hypothetical protein